MFKNRYFTLKAFLASFSLLALVALFTGSRVLEAVFITFVQLPFVAGICYGERLHRVPISIFPPMLASPAISTYIGSFFGTPVMAIGLLRGVPAGELLGMSMAASLIGVLVMAFVGFAVGLILRFGSN